MKNLLVAIIWVTNSSVWAQIEETENTIQEKEYLRFDLVEKIPLSPECEHYIDSSTALQQACFSEHMIKMVSSNYQYPKKARKAGLSAKIYVNFIIEKDGSISNVEVLKGAGTKYENAPRKFRKMAKEMDNEAMRVIKLLKIASPGMQKGKAVRIQYCMPINLKLS